MIVTLNNLLVSLIIILVVPIVKNKNKLILDWMTKNIVIIDKKKENFLNKIGEPFTIISKTGRRKKNTLRTERFSCIVEDKETTYTVSKPMEKEIFIWVF